MFKKLFSFVLVSCFLVSFSSNSEAAWSTDPANPNIIASASGPDTSVSYPNAVGCGKNGAIVFWNEDNNYVYARRIDKDGNLQWSADAAISLAEGGEVNAILSKSDGAGGAIVVWQDYRNGNRDVFAQHVDAEGNVLWTPNGIPVCTAEEDQNQARIASDGAGGVYISWLDKRNSTPENINPDIYAQHISNDGTVLWTQDGINIADTWADDPMPQKGPTIIADGSGNAIITWADERNMEISDRDIYAQKVDADGNFLWGPTGTVVCEAPGIQTGDSMSSDGAGGIVFAWRDKRSGINFELYAQYLDKNGIPQWQKDGILFGSAPGYDLPGWPYNVSYKPGGDVLLFWNDPRNDRGTGRFDIYHNRIKLCGRVVYGTEGKLIVEGPVTFWHGAVSPNRNGSFIMFWNDVTDPENYDVYAQGMNWNADPQWPAVELFSNVGTAGTLWTVGWPIRGNNYVIKPAGMNNADGSSKIGLMRIFLDGSLTRDTEADASANIRNGRHRHKWRR